jgi:16S rRNA (guanine(966)-N(2))-methyltransferase RsmD
VRQALFNLLRPAIEGAIFVDLFAGTGSVGLEALSHGARHVYFVERDRRALPVLRANILRCAVAECSTVVAAALPQALQKLPVPLQADMVFLDPPYASDLAEATLAILAEVQVLAPHGIIVWQHATRRQVADEVVGRPLWKCRRYGETQLSLYAPRHRSVLPAACRDELGSAEIGGRYEGAGYHV